MTELCLDLPAAIYGLLALIAVLWTAFQEYKIKSLVTAHQDLKMAQAKEQQPVVSIQTAPVEIPPRC